MFQIICLATDFPPFCISPIKTFDISILHRQRKHLPGILPRSLLKSTNHIPTYRIISTISPSCLPSEIRPCKPRRNRRYHPGHTFLSFFITQATIVLPSYISFERGMLTLSASISIVWLLLFSHMNAEHHVAITSLTCPSSSPFFAPLRPHACKKAVRTNIPTHRLDTLPAARSGQSHHPFSTGFRCRTLCFVYGTETYARQQSAGNEETCVSQCDRGHTRRWIISRGLRVKGVKGRVAGECRWQL